MSNDAFRSSFDTRPFPCASPFTSSSVEDESCSSITTMMRLRLTGLLKGGVARAKMSWESS